MALILAFGATRATAMGGGGNLSPSESPYAILAPITVAPPAMVDGRAAYTTEEFVPSPDDSPLPPRRMSKRSGARHWASARPGHSRRFDQARPRKTL